MNIQELSTCSQYACPVKIINLRNNYLGMVKQWQDMQYDGRYSESHYAASLPDFVKLAEAYGHVGMEIKSQADLEPAMKEAFALKDRLVFMDIHIDPDEHVSIRLGEFDKIRQRRSVMTFRIATVVLHILPLLHHA